MKKQSRFEWDDSYGKAFEKMKVVSQFVQNHLFDVHKSTRVKGDASKQGLGAALEQLHSDGWKPTSYATRFLNEAELKHNIHELELLVWNCIQDSHRS